MDASKNLHTDIKKIVSKTVLSEHSSKHWGGEFDVLSTPSLVGLVENACMETTDHLLIGHVHTVGANITLNHKGPAEIGDNVDIDVHIIELKGKWITYGFVVRNRALTIADGTHKRVILEKR